MTTTTPLPQSSRPHGAKCGAHLPNSRRPQTMRRPASGPNRLSDAPEGPSHCRRVSQLTIRDIKHPVLLSALLEADCRFDIGVYCYEATCWLHAHVIESVRGYLRALGAEQPNEHIPGYLLILNSHMRFTLTSWPSGECTIVLEDYDSSRQPPVRCISEPIESIREAVQP